jgi:hypothetical protein
VIVSRFYTILFIICCSFIASAQNNDSAKLLRFIPLPSVFFTPETNWGFGATLLGFHIPTDSSTKKSNAQVFLDLTLRKQASFQSDFNIFTKGNRFYIKGSNDLSKFPEFYFGIGNQNDRDNHCLINIAYLDVQVAVYKELRPDFYLGTVLHHQNLNSLDKTIEQSNFQVGDMGYKSSGLGMGMLIDKRNNLLNPSDGHYIEAKLSKYFDGSHRTGGFLSQTLDARYYHSFNKLVLNTNLYTVHNNGTVPFRMMPFLGGPRFMRGYYAGRFRDNNLSFFQAEVRRPVFWRIGVAAFGGAGQVYANLGEFNVKRTHFNYGGGLRFQISKESLANVRLDYGKTKDSHGFYIVFGECF